MGGATAASTVALARAGDEAAFARLVATYHADMVRVAFVACGDREDTELQRLGFGVSIPTWPCIIDLEPLH